MRLTYVYTTPISFCVAEILKERRDGLTKLRVLGTTFAKHTELAEPNTFLWSAKEFNL